ncbi:molybdopterin-guanine dinucleotide biosynthesis protein B [Fontibacillus panacisegetis]|uniref:Molybdopterin-guanine dinucleotide biosynthesis protein B n=1 Tax=Fontibacillus panacisegetis TaxID=670482 RepID=A0A1G7GH74_9BACL|nr:molybdopterin-guanine dinucleotide biosynthesis protein B [Fontibacillus panacisegetis]SDE87477.1 molybdopterin-guanine dinucleotide biosynthesis protein B [Fontibacillus panacisegetis]
MIEVASRTDQKIIQIVGYKNSGKTTLISRLIPILNDMNYKIAVIKHDVHGFDSDVEGTDTYKLRQAGALATAITSPWRTAIMEERETSVQSLIDYFREYDLVILEGFKQEEYPKLVLVTSTEDMQLVRELSQVIGIVYRGLNDKERDLVLALSIEERLQLFEVKQDREIVNFMIGSL